MIEYYHGFVRSFWQKISAGDWQGLGSLFHQDAVIFWPNTNETFTPGEYVETNKNYPGTWTIETEFVEVTESRVLSIVRIISLTDQTTLHASRFFALKMD